MPADLTPDQSRALAGVMVALHDEFRRRHGLRPVPSAWNLPPVLGGIRERARLTDLSVLESGRRGVGVLLTRARRLVWRLLKPVFVRQSDVNHDILLVIDALARDHDHLLHVHRALSARLADLEAKVARLDQRDA